ncbi:Do family serine endopeptidase [Breoghania sp.]|uniref:Do family serine endopeptidase n=1 Tax=Breoghania sp. TaxID=2065378 RepID=UPI002AA8C51A|nr:Do family serine endopeptidase [Breoghania sp.]
MTARNDKKAPSGILRSRRSKLMAGALALTLAGGLTAQTLIPFGQHALADPVRVENAGPADFTGVVKAVQPAVVSVVVRSEVKPVAENGPGWSFGFGGQDAPDFFRNLPPNHPFKRFWNDRPNRRGEQRGAPHHKRRYGMAQGSGFFISDDGFIVTNQHVVEGGDKFTVKMDDGTEYDARLIGADERTDLALLKVDEDDAKFTYVDFAADAPMVGEWVVAVGNPFGLGGSVTAGIVSARGRDIGAGPYDDFIQIDAPINRGNSGGPAFNTRGEVIGINAAIYSPSGGNVGIAFAIPAETAKRVISELKDDGHVVRGWLGVQIQPISQDIADSLGLNKAMGALVASPQDTGPAKGAGIQSGDAILSVDGEPVKDPRALARMIAGYEPGTKVDIELWRDGSKKTVSVELGKMPEKTQVASTDSGDTSGTLSALGLELANAREAGLDTDGVVIGSVDPDGPAAGKGLQAGDVIMEVGGIKVDTPEDVAAQADKARGDGRKAVLMRIQHKDDMRFVALALKKDG